MLKITGKRTSWDVNPDSITSGHALFTTLLSCPMLNGSYSCPHFVVEQIEAKKVWFARLPPMQKFRNEA